MLAPSGRGLILYQAYGNLYAMTGRKAHFLEDKKIPSVRVFDEAGDDITKYDLDIDDLYNNLKVFEANVKGSSGSSSNSQNVAFLSAEDTSSSNEVNTTNSVSTTSGGSTARSMPLRDEEDPIEYGSDAGSTGNNILRMVNTRQGGDQPNIAAIIAEQLQNIIPQIVTQVTANVKQCLECMVAVRGRDAAKWDAHGMTLKAFCLVEEFALVMIWRSLELNYEPQNVQPTTIQSAVLRAGILTDEAISCGTLSKGSEKGRDDEVATSGGILRGD
ncbi:hypothetical protein Tco_1174279 [Tanacetum coccineum]